jgi:hypothetical protein
VRSALVTVGLVLLLGAVAGAQEPPAAPTPSPTPPPPLLKLSREDLLGAQQETGHAEFNLGLRREMWRDPMVRLAYGMGREQASQMRGGPVPLTATDMLMPGPNFDFRLVLAGPFASDWNDLTTQERIGRVAESAVYWGLIVGLARAIR